MEHAVCLMLIQTRLAQQGKSQHPKACLAHNVLPCITCDARQPDGTTRITSTPDDGCLALGFVGAHLLPEPLPRVLPWWGT